MLPYYLQDSAAPLPFAFHHAGLPWAGWVVSIGALFGLSTSLLGAMFPLPRVLYAMASDGIIPRTLAKVHHFFQTPLRATLFSGLLAALMALVFDLSQLVDMMSIGTLLAYTMVAVCVLLLRYKDASSQSTTFCSYTPLSTKDLNDSEEELFPCNANTSNTIVFTKKEYLRQCFNLDKVISPTPLSSHVAHLVHSILHHGNTWQPPGHAGPHDYQDDFLPHHCIQAASRPIFTPFCSPSCSVAASSLSLDQHLPYFETLLADLGQVLRVDDCGFLGVRSVWVEELLRGVQDEGSGSSRPEPKLK